MPDFLRDCLVHKLRLRVLTSLSCAEYPSIRLGSRRESIESGQYLIKREQQVLPVLHQQQFFFGA